MTSTPPSHSGATFAKFSQDKARTKSAPEPAVTDPARRGNFAVAIVCGAILAAGVLLIARGLA